MDRFIELLYILFVILLIVFAFGLAATAYIAVVTFRDIRSEMRSGQESERLKRIRRHL